MTRNGFNAYPSEVGASCVGATRWILCADALYMQITGKTPEEVFPNIGKAEVHA